LLKIITSKLTGNALEVTKYRTLDSWEAIKSILQGAFEHKISETALSIGLNTARMAEGESVAKFANRIEELYYKLCAASTVGLNKVEETVVKNQNENTGYDYIYDRVTTSLIYSTEGEKSLIFRGVYSNSS